MVNDFKKIDFLSNVISKDFGLNKVQVKNTIVLLEEGATIPFISRYRKEKTGNLTETQVRLVSEKFDYFTELEKRKESILKEIENQGNLTFELKKKIGCCVNKNELEDIYLPFKPKKRTRATVAREKGLEGLADIIYYQKTMLGSKQDIVSRYINPQKEVNDYKEAISGALDIVAERISDIDSIRSFVRKNTQISGFIVSSVKKNFAKKQSKFQNYYDFSELIKKSPSHRLLAMRRGQSEKVLGLKIIVDEEEEIAFVESKVVKHKSFLFAEELKFAIRDSFKRLLYPSIEKEVFNINYEYAEKEAINVFTKNLENLLLAPPTGGRVIMGVDPGFRSGCKVVVIDSKGTFKEFKVIFPHEPQKRVQEAEQVVLSFIERFGVEFIAIGNGTASKESNIFIKNLIKKHNLGVKPVIVSEAGASVYSASKNAVKEFPSLDVTVRGAISIARRLQDPLAELVKIDAKSIGVGQYQHDVNQKDLKKSLDLTVESCVNFVGVDLNTASVELLSYVSGLNRKIAENIVAYREKNSVFKQRLDLKKVPKLGKKAFEQCAGFLRIKNSSNPLDDSAIHPEAYVIVKQMSKDLKVELEKLVGSSELVSKINIQNYVSNDFGLLTLEDILNELKKPGIDPRKKFQSVEFSSDINEISDLKKDLELVGTVTNVTNFGAFVDIGVHQDGLVHISNLSNKFVRDPNEIVSVGDTVKVKVLDFDVALKRISLERIV